MEKHYISIWFFIGALLLVYGVLIRERVSTGWPCRRSGPSCWVSCTLGSGGAC